MVSSVTNTRSNKKVSFKDPLCYSTPSEAISAVPIPKKSILKREHTETTSHFRTTTTLCRTTTQQMMIQHRYTQKNNLFQDHPAQVLQKNTRKCSFQDHSSKVNCHFNNKHFSQDPATKNSKTQSSQDPGRTKF